MTDTDFQSMYEKILEEMKEKDRIIGNLEREVESLKRQLEKSERQRTDRENSVSNMRDDDDMKKYLLSDAALHQHIYAKVTAYFQEMGITDEDSNLLKTQSTSAFKEMPFTSVLSETIKEIAKDLYPEPVLVRNMKKCEDSASAKKTADEAEKITAASFWKGCSCINTMKKN